MMNKRELMLSLLDSDADTPYIPAGFFLHFDKKYHHGKAAVQKHLQFFKFTGMDFVKIQYELVFPAIPKINAPEDWADIPFYGSDFFSDHWQIVKGLVDAVGSDALVIMTLYSPFMCASQVAGKELRDQHIREYPDEINKGFEVLTESLIQFVDGCIAQGVDGFYHSTQGGENEHFGDSHLFDQCIKPFDLALMNHVNEQSEYNILHICDYHGTYDDLSPYLDYPGDIVNCNLFVGKKEWSGQSISEMFERPFMGGLDRHGIIVSGTETQIQEEVQSIIQDSPRKFILAADCTLPSDTDWKNIQIAIETAHQFQKK